MTLDMRNPGTTVWLLDGAWGTEFQKKGLKAGECPELWNLTHPAVIQDLVRSYVDAGSRIVLTNTFGANRFVLQRHGVAERVDELNRAAVKVVQDAARPASTCVFGSVGPTGQLMVTGDVAERDVYAAFRAQVLALDAAGVDGLAIETMADLDEACLALRAAKENSRLPVVACMTFDSGPDRMRTMMGVTPEQAAEGLTRAGADAVGANCGAGIEVYIRVCERLRAATPKPLWMKPNNGRPELERGKTVYRQPLGEFLSWVPRLVDAGAQFIGGCCGTTPDHIRGMRDCLRGLGRY